MKPLDLHNEKGKQTDNLEDPSDRDHMHNYHETEMKQMDELNEKTYFFFPGFCLRVHREPKLAEIFSLLMKRGHYIVFDIRSIVGC